MNRTYYPINEETARNAHYLNSFRTYEPGTATNEYKSLCDYVYSIVDEIEQKKPEQAERAAYMADRYVRKLAEHLNAYYRNEASCPSVMVCGPANFPTKKKNKQNARRDTLAAEYRILQEYRDKIKNLLTNTAPIKSGDADALERLRDKVADLEHEKELMKKINAYYRKNRTIEGLEDDLQESIPEDLYRHLIFRTTRLKDIIQATGHVFDTSNINAEIKRLNERIKQIETVKEAGNTETDHEGFKVVENTEIMRLQIIFEYKPDEATRNLLKSNGFKWAPSQNAWQRQLTNNAKYSLNRIINEL